jgi:enamine deaminase RidA (YjgF/YER057c/UK114 family)
MKRALGILALSCGVLAAAGAAQAQVQRSGPPAGAIAQMVGVPAGYEYFFVAGTTAGQPGAPIPADMDSKAQTVVILDKIKAILAAEGLGLGDVVMMRVYMVGVPSKDGHMDNGGMNEAYKTYFGTPEQPNKPARATVQVAALGSPTTLVEIEVQAARKK